MNVFSTQQHWQLGKQQLPSQQPWQFPVCEAGRHNSTRRPHSRQQQILSPQQQIQQPLSFQQVLEQQQQQWRKRRATATAAVPPEHAACSSSKRKLAVFVSGGGSNFKAIHTDCLKGAINAEIVVRKHQQTRSIDPFLASVVQQKVCDYWYQWKDHQHSSSSWAGVLCKSFWHPT